METPWLGGNDIAREGKWVWSDLTKMDFKAWNDKEPNNSGINSATLNKFELFVFISRNTIFIPNT